MKTQVLLAALGAVAIVAVAGVVVASGTTSSVFGLQPRDTGGMGGMGDGHMYDWEGSRYADDDDRGGHMHEWSRNYSYSESPDGCPMNNDWNYSYQYDYDSNNCPCSG
jgi:hypothetical protein